MSPRPIHVVQFGSGNALYGAERWILALIRYLDPARVRTTVVTLKDAPDCPTALVDEARRRGVAAEWIEAPGRLSRRGVRAFADLCRREGADIVHTHGYKPDLYGLLARRRGGYRLLATPHGWNHQRDAKEALYELVNQWIFPFCDQVAPLSEGLRKSLRGLPIRSGRLTVIENGVDVGEIEAVPPAPGGTDGDGFRIGFVGQLIPRKGLDVLLEALARLPPEAWRCDILGEGPARSHLEARAAALGLRERVRFPGFRDDRIALMKRFDLFVLPSYVEGIPRVLMEAMAAGVPVVASDIAGVGDLVEDGATGRLFPAGDAAALGRAIADVMADPEGARKRAEAGRALIHARFSAERMARAYEALYQTMLDRPR
jgi:glycosyltransferase involved in cell wall biosynthesis